MFCGCFFIEVRILITIGRFNSLPSHKILDYLIISLFLLRVNLFLSLRSTAWWVLYNLINWIFSYLTVFTMHGLILFISFISLLFGFWFGISGFEVGLVEIISMFELIFDDNTIIFWFPYNSISLFIFINMIAMF